MQFPNDDDTATDPFARYQDTVWYAHYRHEPRDIGPFWTMAGAMAGGDRSWGTPLTWSVHPNGVPAGYADGYEEMHVRAVHVHP